MVVNRKAERRRLVATMRKQGRGIDDIATEIAGRERCGMLTAYRLAHDLSQQNAIDQYNESLAVHIGDPGFLCRQRIGKLEAWPHSRIKPTLPELVNLARLYGTHPDRLIRPDDLPKLPPSVRKALSHPDPPAENGRTLETPTTHAEVDDMNRRALLNILASAGVGAALPLDSLETLRGTLTRAAGVPDSIDDWHAVAARYAATVQTTPLATILSEALTDLADVSRLLDRGHPERLGLLEVAAQLSGYCAMALYDLGHPNTAFRWWGAARKTADASGKAPLQAWIRARYGLDLLYGPRLAEQALQLADEGVRIAQRTPSVGLAQAQNLRARALAASGHPDARRALEDLNRTCDRLPATVIANDTSWAGFGESVLRSAEASTYLWLKDTPAARRAGEAAIALTPPELLSSVAQAEVSIMAQSLVMDGDVLDGLDRAVAALKRLPDPPLSVRNCGTLVLNALPAKARTLPAAIELRELTYA